MPAESLTVIMARDVIEGDVLAGADGRPNRYVVEVDHHSNEHGMVILRTAYHLDGRATGATILSRTTPTYVLR
jgi:hypothetical protein